jgi:ATP synthase protein I
VRRPSITERAPDQTQFSRQIDASVARKLQAQRWRSQIVWSGLGMMGLIGWSVTVPMLLGAALGIWLDRRHPGAHSWTMALLVAGLALGCWNAWYWISRESTDIQQHGGDEHE